MKLDGERVRERRERLALSMELASSKARVSPNTWVRAEHGDEIRPSSVRRIAEALEVEPGQLMEEPALSGKVGASPSPVVEEKRRPERGAEREEAAELLAEQLASDFGRYPEFLETTDAEVLRGALLDALSRSYWLLDVLRDEISDAREPSPDLKEAMKAAREANRWASELYDQWRALGRVPGRPREARPGAPATPEETGGAAEDTA